MIFNAIDANIMFVKSHEKEQRIIRSADTDVLILIWHFFITSTCIGPYTSQIWIQTGIVTATQNKRRYIPVHDISQLMWGTL